MEEDEDEDDTAAAADADADDGDKGGAVSGDDSGEWDGDIWAALVRCDRRLRPRVRCMPFLPLSKVSLSSSSPSRPPRTSSSFR